MAGVDVSPHSRDLWALGLTVLAYWKELRPHLLFKEIYPSYFDSHETYEDQHTDFLNAIRAFPKPWNRFIDQVASEVSDPYLETYLLLTMKNPGKTLRREEGYQQFRVIKGILDSCKG